MASLIKNQILKHLSKFAKNLSPDKINISTLKGEGELTNLELNEDVLMDVLELPLWIRLTKAVCNKVACKIMWTKLKSVPILMCLDEVLVEMETCEELRPHAATSTRPSYSSGAKYGFSDRVIDGMTVTINSVSIIFKSPAFHASFQMSRLCLDSRTPTWQRSDLRMTRLKEPDRQELLIFKQLEWQTLRVEATAVKLEEKLTPLRLITNQARCRITIKKRLTDCSVLGSRLVLILDDLLWVLTDSQLKAALHFASSLSGLIQRATELAQKTKAARKFESLAPTHVPMVTQQPRQTIPSPRQQMSAVAKIFYIHDVVETSYHFCSGQIDLHLCDEVSPEELRSCHPQLSDGGAMQISFHNLAIDYYPYHLASGDRKHWLRYKETSTSRSTWVSALLADFRHRLNEVTQGESARAHVPVHRSLAHGAGQDLRHTPAQAKGPPGGYLSRLMSMCLVVRMDDFTIFRVSTSGTRNGTPQKFIGSDKGRLLLPDDLAAIHLEITQYYYPGDSDVPVPPTNMFCMLNPIQVTYDALTILWLNAFSLNLQRSQILLNALPQEPKAAPEIRIEALMPRVVIPTEKDYPNQPDRPKQLQFQISRLVMSNSRIGDQCGRMELGKCLETLQQGDLFFCSTFPSTVKDYHPVVDAFVQHSLSRDREGLDGTGEESAERFKIDKDFQNAEGLHTFNRVKKDQLWSELKNIWCVSMDPVWADFSGVETNRNRPVPFLDAFPLTVWIYQNPASLKMKNLVNGNLGPSDDSYGAPDLNTPTETTSIANIHMLAHVQSLVNVQLNHYQYVFLLRALDSVAEMSKQLARDTSHITCQSVENVSSSCAAVIFPELDVSFVMPIPTSQESGKSSGQNEVDDVESVNSRDSLPTDAVNTPDDPLGVNAAAGRVKESISEHTSIKDGIGREREGSVASSIAKSCSDSLLDSKAMPNGSPDGSSPFMARSQDGFSGAKLGEDEDSSSMSASFRKFAKGRRESSGEWANLDKVPDNIQKTLASGSSVVKKGFSSFLSSLDSAIASGRSTVAGPLTGERRGPSSDDVQGLEDWETMSIRSDMSSDSDQFLMVHMDNQPSRLEDALFSYKDSRPTKVERANEMKEDSNSNPSSSSLKRPELVTVLTLRIGKSECIQHSYGFDSVFRYQCSSLGTVEHGNISWDDFQTKFSARSRGWQETDSDPSMKPCEIKFRLETGPSAEEICPLAGDVGILTTIMRNISLSLLMSNVSGLGDFLEDEIIPIPMPLRIYLHNFSAHLEENRPSVNLTNAGAVPLDVHIPSMTIRRETDGVFQIQPLESEIKDLVTQKVHLTPSKSEETRRLLAKLSPTPVSFSIVTGETSMPSFSGDALRSSGYDPTSINHYRAATNYLASDSHQSQPSTSHSRLNNTESLMEANEQLRMKLLALDSLEVENEHLRSRLMAETSRAEEATRRLRELEEEVFNLQEEKRTLMETRNVLQDELMAVEKQHRENSYENATG